MYNNKIFYVTSMARSKPLQTPTANLNLPQEPASVREMLEDPSIKRVSDTVHDSLHHVGQGIKARVSISPEMQQKATLAMRLMKAQYDFLPMDSQTVQYLNGRIKHIFPDQSMTVMVLANEDKPNGMSFPDGTIVLTKGLLKLFTTESELDFVLAHEGIHFIKGHTEEIGAIFDRMKRHLTSVEPVRFLGAQRIHEYEADIRGVIVAANGKVNPSGARSALMKLDAHDKRKRKKSDTAHGAIIDRIVNIGIVSKFYDFEATSHAEKPLPDSIAQFTSTETRPSLFALKGKDVSITDFENSLEHGSVAELLLALKVCNFSIHKIKPGMHFSRPLSHSQLKGMILSQIEKKIARTFPAYSQERKTHLIRNLLEIFAGIATDQAGEPFERYAGVSDDIDSVDDLLNSLDVLKPEVFQTLNLVIPSIQDLIDYFEDILQIANENEMFMKNGIFQSKEYIIFTKRLFFAVNNTARYCALDTLRIEHLTSCIISEGLLNLDLRKSQQSIPDFLQILSDEGIALDVNLVMTILSSHRHVVKHADIGSIEAKLVGDDHFLKAIRVIENANYTAQRLDMHFDYQSPDVILENGIHPLEALFRNMSFDTFDSLKTFLSRLIEYHTMKSVTQKSEEISAAIQFMFAYFVLQGASFLPNDIFQRAQIMLALYRSMDNFESNEIINQYLAMITLSDEIDHKFPHDRNQIMTIGEIVTGKSEFYGKYNLQAPAFSPKRHFTNFTISQNFDDEGKKANNDSKKLIDYDTILFNEFIQKYYFFLNQDITSEKSFEKSALLAAFRTLDSIVLPEGLDSLPAPSQYNNLLVNIFAYYNFDIQDPLDQEILLYCSGFFGDPSLRAILQQAIITRQFSQADFQKKLYTLFSDPRTKLTLTSELRSHFIETDAQTHHEIKATEDSLQDYMSFFDDAENIGSFVIFEKMLHSVADKQKLFQIFMETGYSDAELRTLIFSLVRAAEAQSDEESIIMTELIESQIFGSNEMIKYALVRNLLIGDCGLLIKNPEWVLDYLLKRHIAKPHSEDEQQMRIMLEEVLRVMVATASPDMLFFGIAPIIHKNILRYPKKTVHWKDILPQFDYDPLNIPITAQRAESLNKGEAITVRHAGMEKEVTLQSLDSTAGHSLSVILAVMRLVGPEASGSSSATSFGTEKWPVGDFLIQFAKSLGSAGLRFLQIVGQCVKLPPDLESAIQDVYDNVEGQSKITAYETICREWPTFPHEATRIIKRIGGGSLLSVYLVEMVDGSKRVVKVLNPNALMQVNMTIDILKKTFHSLSSLYPEKYHIAGGMVNDIHRWIEEDIRYPSFLDQDKKFRQKNHGFSVPDHEYDIYIPQSFSNGGGESMYVKSEEYINGVTLVRADSLAGHDRKQIASVIAKNYIQQIFDGQVHADVHPGNFLVFRDDLGKGHIAIIDRNNYIQLDDSDRDFLISSLDALDQPLGFISSLIRYFEIQGTIFTDVQKDRFTQRLKDALSSKNNLVDAITNVIIEVRKEGIEIPLRLTLMVKNMNALHHLCTTAGFSSVEEAVQYQTH